MENLMKQLEVIVQNNDLTTEEIRFGQAERYVNGTRTTISSIWYELDSSVEKLEGDMDWIAIMLLKKYFGMLLPMLVVPAQEIIEGNMDRLNLIRDFRNKLEAHPLNAVWTEKKKQVLSVAHHLGINRDALFDDVAGYSECIIRARETDLFRIRKGKKGEGETHISPYIYSFDTERAFVDNLIHSKESRCIIVAKIRESEKNVSYDGKIKHPAVCVGVKNGENIFLSYPKTRTGQYSGDQKYYYGERCTYMPVSILEKDGKQTGNTLPDGKEEKWVLAKLLDEERMIFFPFHVIYLISEAEKDELPLTFLREETSVFLPDQTCTYPAVIQRNTVHLPDLKDVIRKQDGKVKFLTSKQIQTKSLLRMFEYFNMSYGDIELEKVMPPYLCTEDKYQEYLEGILFELSEQAIRKKIREYYFEGDSNINHSSFYKAEMQRCLYYGKQMPIFENLQNGIYDDIAVLRIDKKPFLDENGEQLLKDFGTWYSNKLPAIQYTEIDDGREGWNELVYFMPETLYNRRPPVVIRISPKTPEDYERVFGYVPPFAKIQADVNNCFDYINHECYFSVHVRFVMGKKEFKKHFKDHSFKQDDLHIRADQRRRN